MTTKISPFIANYGREMRMGVDLKRKEKIEKATEFVERVGKVQKEASIALTRIQEEMKREADRGRKKVKE